MFLRQRRQLGLEVFAGVFIQCEECGAGVDQLRAISFSKQRTCGACLPIPIYADESKLTFGEALCAEPAAAAPAPIARHTHASMLINAGIDILTISRRLGHSKASVTLDVYGHLVGGADAAAAKAIGKVLK